METTTDDKKQGREVASSVVGRPSSTRSYWWYVQRLIRYRPGLYVTSGMLASTMFYLFPLVPGLVIRGIFDGLSGSAPADFNAMGLLALLVAVAVVQGRVGAGGRSAPR